MKKLGLHCESLGCSDKYVTKGYCSKHYSRLRKRGTLDDPKPRKIVGDRYTYDSWRSMVKRCDPNTKSSNYIKYYVSKGITVCERWANANGYENFVKDMGLRPSGKTIDRIDNSHGYSKENCKWSTKTEQGVNRKIQSNNTSGFRGVSKIKGRNLWCAYIKIDGATQRIGLFRDIEEAAIQRDCAALQVFGAEAPLNILFK